MRMRRAVAGGPRRAGKETTDATVWLRVGRRVLMEGDPDLPHLPLTSCVTLWQITIHSGNPQGVIAMVKTRRGCAPRFIQMNASDCNETVILLSRRLNAKARYEWWRFRRERRAQGPAGCPIVPDL